MNNLTKTFLAWMFSNFIHFIIFIAELNQSNPLLWKPDEILAYSVASLGTLIMIILIMVGNKKIKTNE